MNQLFYLDDLEIQEPVGFAEIEFSIKRDDVFHGMSYEASTSSLQFYGEAYTYLKNKKETEGVKANVTFRALSTCDTYDYEELISGRLNFGKFKESCGDQCTVSLPIEQESCAVILQARKDQKVDVDKNTGVDNTTLLGAYAGLAVETELPAHELDARVEGYVVDAGDVVIIDPDCDENKFMWVRPTYARELFNSITEGQLIPINTYQLGHDDFARITPQLLYDDNISCFTGEFNYSVRMKGNFTVDNASLTISPGGARIQLVLLGPESETLYCNASNVFDYSCVVNQVEFFTSTGAYMDFDEDFDETLSGTVTIPQGYGLYAWVYFPMGFTCDNPLTVTFDPETYFLLDTTKSCPATNADLYLIHETLSRVSEAITNGCVRVKSSFYGRTDSEPFSFPADGCGGLRSVTSGLKIRQAIEDKFFTSLKDLLEGLNAIDNIGFDIIADPDGIYGALLRVEGVDYFYQEVEILRHDAIPKGDSEVEENKHYSRINVGYKKWEVERVNGLDEFNSNREYNTSIDTINGNLDITSILVAGTYAIEITRQQSFADSGGADTKYDNDTFIICMERPAYPYGGLQVELGNITNAANIFSPATIYNYRLSPLRNLMRWYKTIAAGFASLSDALNMLFFTSGTGNLIASGLMTDTVCRMENSDLQENQNIFVTKFTNASDYTPLWKNELITYEYPMSIADYRAIKENPYGYISAQCGNGAFQKYWIKEIKYKPMKGTATIAGRLKYGT